jgi:hydrogenase maturation protein HypF
VVVTVEGEEHDLNSFLERVARDKPAPAVLQDMQVNWSDPSGLNGFHIESSRVGGAVTAQVVPDIATCAACLSEIRARSDRRFAYPFTNCTLCGPRFSILRSLPYDRPRTSMAGFMMCGRCEAEFDHPADRRFHAQPIACPDCGPEICLWNSGGRALARGNGALREAARAIVAGQVVAVKGLGGFHLMVDARNGAAVARLRERKPRREKPLALMVQDLDQAREICRVDETAASILSSPEAPILLLPRVLGCGVHDAVAPGNPSLGIMLPYTPLHHLLLERLGFPVVATSGNLSDEPICTDEREAIGRLAWIADRFLVHDRPIVRHVDDSVAWQVRGEMQLLRRARGFAPRPVCINADGPAILAVGPHLKNTVALRVGKQVVLSQHIGDLETPEALEAFETVISDFLELYEARPAASAHDCHPGYLSTQWAHDASDGCGPAWGRLQSLAGLRLIPVQHHHAHLASCLADNACSGPALGVIWDGTGYGTDGSVWGGEFLLGDAGRFRRVAHLRPFLLPGGEAAVREPRRAALGILWDLDGEDGWHRSANVIRAFRPTELPALTTMLSRGLQAPSTTSAGRLFDGVAALIGLHPRTSFEGQAAMALEHLSDPAVRDAYPLELRHPPGLAGQERPAIVLDWGPMIDAILTDLQRGAARGTIAARFHNTLVDGIVAVAREVGERRVALSGGCFQNRLLLERAVARLEAARLTVLLHRQVPPNDGGISLGQVAVAAAQLGQE